MKPVWVWKHKRPRNIATQTALNTNDHFFSFNSIIGQIMALVVFMMLYKNLSRNKGGNKESSYSVEKKKDKQFLS